MKITLRNYLKWGAMVLGAGFWVGCQKEAFVEGAAGKPSVADSSLVKKEVQPEKVLVHYDYFIFPSGKKGKDSAMALFNEKYDEAQQHVILALNRLDKKNKWRADTLVVPKEFRTAFLDYSPFPSSVEALKPVKKIALFSYPKHAYALYEEGKLIKWGPSSFGKKATPTKVGLMFANWKKELAISTSNSNWKLPWNVNLHNTRGIAWHQYDLPGFHASHSCLRLLEEDAKWMYSWADTWVLTEGGASVKAKGTPVIVYGDLVFKNRPWLKLAGDPKANNTSEEDLTAVVTPYLEEILKEQSNAETVRGPIVLSTMKPTE
ncbi:L,D-transpeptidase [Bergeyella sp. RCAD1439]|uniref:L,D-transpeptidase n=1 Tax=Bergeyella anatis TaxID=3113737 RepID=UPI002E1760F7|nr:L,D-transpeptidase [Bergeyella sp. RCAD1439]